MFEHFTKLSTQTPLGLKLVVLCNHCIGSCVNRVYRKGYFTLCLCSYAAARISKGLYCFKVRDLHQFLLFLVVLINWNIFSIYLFRY
jgi:hypothetical protein